MVKDVRLDEEREIDIRTSLKHFALTFWPFCCFLGLFLPKNPPYFRVFRKIEIFEILGSRKKSEPGFFSTSMAELRAAVGGLRSP